MALGVSSCGPLVMEGCMETHVPVMAMYQASIQSQLVPSLTTGSALTSQRCAQQL